MAGGSKSKSEPKDVTPEVFKDLQLPFASVVGQLLGFTQQPSPFGQQTGVPANTGPGTGGAPAQQPTRNLSLVEQARRRRDSGNPMQSIQQGGSAQASAFNQPKAGPYQPQGDITDVLRGIPGYEGQTVAGLGANEQTLLDRLMGLQTGGQGGQGTGSPATDLLTRTIGGEFLPGQTDLGQYLQGINAARTQPQPGQGSSLEQFMASIRGNLPGQQTGSLDDFMSQFRSAAGPVNNQSLEQFAQERAGAFQSQGYDPNENNPFMQAAIEAAQRPTMQALEETLGRTLPGRFTSAGHFTQPGGSSAFDRAAAIATRGAGQTMGDIAANISFASTEAERGRQFQAQEGERSRESDAIAAELDRRGIFGEAARAREGQALQQELERRGQFGESARAREAQMLAAELERRGQHEEAARVREDASIQAELERQAGATEAERTRQQAAAQQLPGITQQEVQTTISNLQAQALPRMIQELGIERGLEQFQNRMNTLLAVLGIGAGTTAPVIGQSSSSKTKPNVLGPVMGAM